MFVISDPGRLVLTLLLISMTTWSTANSNWCYQNPACKQGANGSGWEEGLCKNGNAQSPINLDPNVNVSQPTDTDDFRVPQPDRNIKNFTLAASSGIITLTPQYFARMQFYWHRAYLIDHIEFHWGPYDNLGSEHALDGGSASMEMHVVYLWDKFGSYEEAVSSGEKGAVAILGYLLVADPNKRSESSGLAPVVSNLDKIANSADKKVFVENQTFDLEAFLPTGSTAIAYQGSVTSPPCQEVVLWFIVRAQIPIQPTDVEAFRNAIKDQDGNWVKMNYRKLQPLNSRQVKRGWVF